MTHEQKLIARVVSFKGSIPGEYESLLDTFCEADYTFIVIPPTHCGVGESLIPFLYAGECEVVLVYYSVCHLKLR